LCHVFDLMKSVVMACAYPVVQVAHLCVVTTGRANRSSPATSLQACL
jgi:hypothetical protein